MSEVQYVTLSSADTTNPGVGTAEGWGVGRAEGCGVGIAVGWGVGTGEG